MRVEKRMLKIARCCAENAIEENRENEKSLNIFSSLMLKGSSSAKAES
jgi:hypothetical protein